ncbi:hypothetical protein, partial [Thiolapillus sp.]
VCTQYNRMSVLTLHSQQIPSAPWQFKSINGSQDGNQSCSLQTEYRNKYYSSAASHSSGIDVTLCVLRKSILLGAEYMAKKYYSLPVAIFSDIEAH